MDCLPELNKHIVAEIPTANRRQKVAFAMEKGDVVDFGTSMDTIVLGLGWDVDHGEIDLDASAILFDQFGEVLESVFFGNLKSSGGHSQSGAVEHSGDNLTGAGDGDDEQIVVRLNSLGATVRDVFFCIHIYSKGRDGRPKTFKDVANPYCRVVEGGPAGEELCRYMLSEGRDYSGLIIARLRRGLDGRFGFNALGEPSHGTMYKDAIADMKRMCSIDPRALQAMGTRALRSQTATSLAEAGSIRPGAPPLPLVPQAAQKDCCTLQ
jgi:tellurium resistance protein TerZ